MLFVSRLVAVFRVFSGLGVELQDVGVKLRFGLCGWRFKV